MKFNFHNWEEYEIWKREEAIRRFFAYFFILVACLLLWFGIFLIFSPGAHAYTFDQYADAIFKAENSKSHPYGIMVKYRHTSPRHACLNTIRHSWVRFCRNHRNSPLKPPIAIDFTRYLASTYAPLNASNDLKGLNKNWIKNVTYFLSHE